MIEHGEIKIVFMQKIQHYQLAFLVLRNAAHTTGEESNHQVYFLFFYLYIFFYLFKLGLVSHIDPFSLSLPSFLLLLPHPRPSPTPSTLHSPSVYSALNPENYYNHCPIQTCQLGQYRMNVMGVTNHCLIAFRVCCTRWIQYQVLLSETKICNKAGSRSYGRTYYHYPYKCIQH